jgi:hypothetical protein
MGATLVDALKEEKMFGSIKDMFEHLALASDGAFNVRDLSISYQIYDNRIGEDVYYVLTSRYRDENYLEKYGHPIIVGYCSFASNAWLRTLRLRRKGYRKQRRHTLKEVDEYDS